MHLVRRAGIFRRRIASCLAAALLAINASAAADPISEELVAKHLDALQGNIPLLIKWTEPIRYRVMADSITAQQRATLLEPLLRVARELKIPIQESKEGSDVPVTLAILLGDDPQRLALEEEVQRIFIREEETPEQYLQKFAALADGGSLKKLSVLADFRIDYVAIAASTVVLRPESLARFRLELVLSALVTVGQSDHIGPSMLNPANGADGFEALPKADMALLRAIYDPSVRHGKMYSEVRPIVVRRMAEWMRVQ
jgi:hypothetical protein